MSRSVCRQLTGSLPLPRRGHPHRQGGGGLQGHRRRHLGGLHAQEGGDGEEGPAEGQRGHLQDSGSRPGQIRQEDGEGEAAARVCSPPLSPALIQNLCSNGLLTDPELLKTEDKRLLESLDDSVSHIKLVCVSECPETPPGSGSDQRSTDHIDSGNPHAPL